MQNPEDLPYVVSMSRPLMLARTKQNPRLLRGIVHSRGHRVQTTLSSSVDPPAGSVKQCHHRAVTGIEDMPLIFRSLSNDKCIW